jgi:hypothetical protein
LCEWDSGLIKNFLVAPDPSSPKTTFVKRYSVIEVVSKPQIRLKGKAQADEKAQHTR